MERREDHAAHGRHDRRPSRALISTVIASRGHSSHLAQAVECALGQTSPPLEVVVVSYGPDAAPAAEDKRVTWRPEPGIQGASAARNRGVRAARGEWIAFLEDRDLWAPEHIATLAGACEENAADFGYCAAWLVDAERRIRGFSSVPAPERLRRALWADNAIGSPSSVVVRRSLWERAGGFDEWLEPLSPWDLWIRWSRCARMCMSSEPTVAQTNREDGGERLARELRELRRRYGGDAKADGVRFGAASGRALEAAVDGSPRPPWLVETGTAAESVEEPER